MELAPEDLFRLNVLLANRPQAIRIDETALVVWGLGEGGEARVPLNPSGRPEPYLKRVREFLSGHFLGSPGGYPLFLGRWTRMGQMRDESLAPLLLLGEPEAVVAATGSPGLTDELARRAWWCQEDPDNARRMLAHPAVVAGRMGPVLAAYLFDYLPFETEPEQAAEAVRLMLRPGLLTPAAQDALWRKAQARPAYLVGFLAARADTLPEPLPARSLPEAQDVALTELAQAGNGLAGALLRLFSPQGQRFLHTLERVLEQPPTQDLLVTSLDLLRAYLRPLRPEGDPDLTLAALGAEAEDFCGRPGPPEARACVALGVDVGDCLRAARILSGLGYGALRPLLRDTTATGGLLRRKLEPALGPARALLASLR